MAASIFKNFDPDEMASRFNVNTSFGAVPNLYLVIVQALVSCGKWEWNASLRTLRDINNSDLINLEASVNDLAKIGFENKESLPWHEDDVTSIQFDDYAVVEWALHGKECSPNAEITTCQINAMAALWLIDDAITCATKNGVTVEFIEALAMAAFYLSEARDADASDSRKHLATAIPSALEIEYKQRQHETFSRRAKLRHSASNKARDFVQQEWDKHKNSYQGNKSAFARDYVRMVANKFQEKNGDPLKVTEKTIREAWLKDYPVC